MKYTFNDGVVKNLKLVKKEDNAPFEAGDVVPYKITVTGLENGKVPDNMVGSMLILEHKEAEDAYSGQLWDYKGETCVKNGANITFGLKAMGVMDIFTPEGVESYRFLRAIGLNKNSESEKFMNRLYNDSGAKPVQEKKISFNFLVLGHYHSSVLKDILRQVEK